MLVSHAKQFIFLKTMKTAGTSVEIYFEKFCRDDGGAETHVSPQRVSNAGIVAVRGDIPPGTTYWNHMPAKEFKEKIGEEIWSKYKKFSVVRNPFDKVVSAFWFYYRNMSIPDDLEAIIPIFRKYVIEGNLPIDKHVYTIDGVLCNALYMRYENLNAEMANVCNVIDVPFEPARLGNYKGEYRPKSIRLKDYFDDETIARVRLMFAHEFEWFNYSANL